MTPSGAWVLSVFLAVSGAQQTELNYRPKVAPLADFTVQAPALPQPVPTVPTVTLPETIKLGVKPAVKIVPQTNGKVIKWALGDAAGVMNAVLIPNDNGTWVIFACNVPGDYVVIAVTAIGDVPSDFATCIVTVGTPPPPVPPGPPPTPPAPNDPWYPQIAAAFVTETAADKMAVSALSSCWKTAASSVKNSGSTPGLAWFQTNVITPTQAVLGTTTLLSTRKAVERSLNSVLKISETAPISPADQTAAAAAFTRIGVILDYLGAQKR